MEKSVDDYLLNQLFDGQTMKGDPMMVILQQPSPINMIKGTKKLFHIQGPDMTPYIGKNIWIYYIKTMAQFPAKTHINYYYVNVLPETHRHVSTGDYIFTAKLVPNGDLPSSVLMITSSENNKSFTTIQMYDFHNRVGPSVMTFSLDSPRSNMFRSVNFGRKQYSCDGDFDDRYNFFGKEFFKDEIEKLEFMATGVFTR